MKPISFTVRFDGNVVAYGDPKLDEQMADQVSWYIDTYQDGQLVLAIPGWSLTYDPTKPKHVAYATAQYISWLYKDDQRVSLTLDGIDRMVRPKQPRDAIN